MMKKFIFLVYLSIFASQSLIMAQKPIVFTMKIDDQIDPRMNRYTELALNQAISDSADYVIIEMDTYGGAVNDADDIRTRIMDFEIPIYVFINKDAASAGALISIACDSIFMAPGSSIGAATVVVGGSGEAAPDKYQSYMRSMMRSTAEAKGRDPKIAEAMVDQSIEIEGITKAGQVLTFSTSEAIEHGFCEAEVRSIEDLLSILEINEYTLIEFELSGIEKIIRFFLNPLISGLLILIIVGGIYFELQTPGVGFPILASLTALILYFVPYYLTGLADHWEIALFFVGVGLLALEIFVIPGFGIAGITGLVFTLGSLVLVMLNNDALDFTFVQMDDVFIAISTTLAGLLGAIIVMMIGGIRLTNTAFFKKISLQDVQLRTEGFSSKFPSESLQGKTGSTYTVLRPSGKILIDGNLYDAYTRGEFIDSGKEVIVIEESGTSLKVREKTI